MVIFRNTFDRLSSAWTHSAKAMRYGWIAAVLLLLGQVGTVTVLAHNPDLALGANILPIAAGLASVVVMLLAASKSRPTSQRTAMVWLLFAVAQVFELISRMIWLILASGQSRVTVPSLADFFSLSIYPLVIAATLYMPARKLSRNEWLKALLDDSIVILSTALAYFIVILWPLNPSLLREPQATQAILLANPIGQVLMLLAFLLLLVRLPAEQHLPFLFVICSIPILFVTTILYDYQLIVGAYQNTVHLSFGYLCLSILLGLGGIAQLSRMHTPKKELNHQNDQVMPAEWMAFLPYLWLALTLLSLFWVQFNAVGVSLRTVTIWVGLIIGLFMIRQIISVQENHTLSKKLVEALYRVQKQAKRLENMNQYLKDEITERIRAEEQMVFDVQYDPLTNLPNKH